MHASLLGWLAPLVVYDPVHRLVDQCGEVGFRESMSWEERCEVGKINQYPSKARIARITNILNHSLNNKA